MDKSSVRRKRIVLGVVRSVLLIVAVNFCCQSQAKGQEPLPQGAGRKIVETVCTLCHTLTRVVNARYTQEDWEALVNRMVQIGAPLKPEEIPLVIKYLATNFSGGPKTRGVTVPGPVKVTIKEWKVPTPGSEPHDAIYTPDGAVWYTASFRNLLGRFDTKTQQFKEYPLRTPNSIPHGLVADKEGNIWFTAAGGGYIGELDPKTGRIKEFSLNNPDAKWPHTAVFDHNGNLLFTVTIGNMLGRLNPKTGEVNLVTLPTPNAGPYGLVPNSRGIFYFTERDVPQLGSIDSETMEVTEYVMPNPKIGPRRLALDSHDVVWFTDSARGYLDRYNPKTKEFKEWPSPSGPKSFPYGMTIAKNSVWYVESEVKPNMLVRFDIQTEKFQSWPIPSGGGIVANMSLGTDDEIWFSCRGTDTIALAKVERN